MHLVFSHQRLWCAAPAREKKGLAIYHSRPLRGSPPVSLPIMSDAQIANALGMIVAGMAQSYGNSGALFDDAFSGIFGF